MTIVNMSGDPNVAGISTNADITVEDVELVGFSPGIDQFGGDLETSDVTFQVARPTPLKKPRRSDD